MTARDAMAMPPIAGTALFRILMASVLAVMAAACTDDLPTELATPDDPSSAVTGTRPDQVTDLSVVSATDNSVTLTFTEVNDGAGRPARYQLRYALSPIGWGWGSATPVQQGNCAEPIIGTAIGAKISCMVPGLTAKTTYDFQLVAWREQNGTRTYSKLSNVATGTTVTPVPATVTDLAVSSSTQNSVTLSWTEVNDGTGQPAKYQVRYAQTPLGWGWGSATIATQSTCTDPIRGSTIGAKLSCTVTGLASGTTYDFQLVALRHDPDRTVYSEALSNIATGITAPPLPGTVTDLRATSVGENSMTLSWTEVNDGTGQPAKYLMKYARAPIAWGSATAVTEGTCADPIKGNTIGATLSCTVPGLISGASYDFQLVSLRHDPEGTVYSAGLSNVASGNTAAAVASVSISPSSVTLQPAQTSTLTATVRDANGNTLAGRTVTWASTNASVATVDAAGMVTAMAAGTATITATSSSVTGSAAVTVAAPAPAPTLPSTVTDLSAGSATDNTVTLSWTEVNDGTGRPANYQVRYAVTPLGWGWGSATVATQGTCADPVKGKTIGARLSCTVTGLASGTSYDFQLVSFRWDPDRTVYSEGLSNVATSQTTASTPVAASVQVTPSTLSLQPGQSAQLTATVVDALGNVLSGYAVTWSSSNVAVATVSSTGLVTAVTAGSATITATGSGSGTSSVTVTGSTPPPAPPPSSGGYANQPSGYTTIADRPFNLTIEDGWIASATNFAIIPDATAPQSSPTVGRATFPAGWSGGYEPMWTEKWIEQLGYTRVYVSFWLRVSENWQGHPVVNKGVYVWTHGKGVVTIDFVGADDAPLRSSVRLQDMPVEAMNLTANLTDVEIKRGQWHHWEIFLVNNTGDTADGQVQWWIDGVKVGDYRNIPFSSSSQSKAWDNLAWRPVWGGGPGTVRQTMYMDMDHFYASGSR